MPSTTTDRLDGLTTSVAVKAPCVVASTGNLTLSSTQTIDGYNASTGERVLVKDQTTATENGIYGVRAGTWAREGDCDGARDLVKGTMVFVSTGSTVNVNFARNFTFGSTSSTSNVIAPGSDTMTITPITTLAVPSTITVTGFAETYLDDPDAATVRATLDVQQLDTQLSDLAGITPSTGGTLFFAAASTLSILAKGSSGRYLQQGSSEPAWAVLEGNVAFPASQSASADANTLDDYEEGTWTPDLSDGTNSDATQSTEFGNYTKIGRMVNVKFKLIISSLGSVSGELQINGLPFTAENVTNAHASGVVGFATALAITAAENITLRIVPNTAHIFLETWDVNTGTTGLTEAEYSADGSIEGEITYYV